MKNYTLKEQAKGASDDIEQRTIEVSEEVVETKSKRVTIAQLKQERQSITNQIRSLINKADEISDEIDAIEKSLGITVKDKPEKIKGYTPERLKKEVDKS